MTSAERERFDALLDRVLDELPQRIHRLLEEAPVIVDDRPSRKLLMEVGLDPEQVCRGRRRRIRRAERENECDGERQARQPDRARRSARCASASSGSTTQLRFPGVTEHILTPPLSLQRSHDCAAASAL